MRAGRARHNIDDMESNMKKIRSVVVAIAASTAVLCAHASEAQIRKALGTAYPDIPIASVTSAPVKGLFEVVVGSDILYTDGDGKHLVQGSIIDGASKNNLTEARLQIINKVDFKDLPLDRAIVQKYGTGQRKMVVFADPNCGFCKRLEREQIPALKDVTIYTLLIPILSKDSVAKSNAIWCAPDRAKAWDDWMQRAVEAPAAASTCDVAGIDANLSLARKIRVTGTPTMFFEDGARLPGAVPAAEIEKHLAAK